MKLTELPARLARWTAAITAIAASVIVARAGLSHPAAAQTSPAIDFRRDIQPLLKERCLECHGPRRQQNGLRLDERSSVVAGQGRRARIRPGSSATSALYLRLIG